ncbi:hypothetical protein [Methylocystis echinoides]|uniref:hypothetical protein n=1 Tax=Methylocystis echinoides TaxID=29468 RepID=UPI00343E7414
MATLAEVQLQRLKAERPPTFPSNASGADRVQALAAVLRPNLPENFRARIDSGSVAIGEVGRPDPDAETVRFEDGSNAIIVTSGMMHFVYAVTRAMSGVATFTSNGAPTTPQAKSVEEAVALIADVFKMWRRHCQPTLIDLWRKKGPIEHARFPVAPQILAIAEDLASSAELFMIAHELAHACFNLGLTKPRLANEETSADMLGLGFYAQPASQLVGVRTAFAGAVLAVRIIAALERSGARFSAAYPPCGARVQNMLQELRAFSPSQQFYDEASTILVAHLDMMDDVDRRLGKPDQPRLDRLWQARVRMIAVLQEIGCGRQAPGRFPEMWELTQRDLTAAEQTELAATLVRYLEKPDPDCVFLPQDMRGAMLGGLGKGVALLSEPARALFAL